MFRSISFILFALLLSFVLSEDYPIYISVQDNSIGNQAITSLNSGMNTYIVGTEEGRVYTFTKEYGYSEMYTNLTIGSDKIVAVDISQDQLWALVVDEAGKAYVLKNDNRKFKMYQVIDPSAYDGTSGVAGAIAKDHEKIAIGMMSGKVIIYDHDDHDHDDHDDHLNFTYSRTLTNPSFEVSYLSFSSDDMLAVSQNGENVFIYDSSFTLNQTITITNISKIIGVITEQKDEVFLTFSYGMNVVLYKYSSGQFQQQSNTAISQTINFASYSPRYKMLAISTDTMLQFFNKDLNTSIQTINKPSQFHNFFIGSGNFLSVTDSNQNITRYTICDKGQIHQYFYDYEEQKCVLCSFENGCMLCNADTFVKKVRDRDRDHDRDHDDDYDDHDYEEKQYEDHCGWWWWWLSPGQIAGIVVGSIILLIIIIVVSCLIYRRCKDKTPVQINDFEMKGSDQGLSNGKSKDDYDYNEKQIIG